jgi:hypothetical protein
MQNVMNNIDERISQAVQLFWRMRDTQKRKQEVSGTSDQGTRGMVTGGAQMDGFISLFSELIINVGIEPRFVFQKKSLELPGYFRPTKEWDLLVVKDDQLILALEAKSQVGPSFGNNFNNRTEEAMGSALDLWTAFREGAFNTTVRPWLGYLFFLEDCVKSRKSVRVQEPHFKVFPEFRNASYLVRYELFCRKLIRERYYDASAFLASPKDEGMNGLYHCPSDDLAVHPFIRALVAHVSAHGEKP